MPRFLRISTAAASILALGALTASAEIIVQPGDTLWRIAARELGDGQRWRDLAEVNGIAEPYTIEVGRRLRLPGNATEGLRRSASGVSQPSESSRIVPPLKDEAPIRTNPPSSPPAVPSDEFAPLPGVLADDSFIPLSLDEAFALAMRNNIGLRSTQLDPVVSAASVDVERAAFDPTLTLSAEEAWSRTRSATGYAEARTSAYSAGIGQTLRTGTSYDVDFTTSRTRTTARTTSYNPNYDAEVTLSLTQPLLEGAGVGAATAPLAEAKERLAAAQRRTGREGVTTRAAVAAAYWSLAQAEAQEALARQSLSVAEELLIRNRRLEERGLLAAVEVITAEAGVAARREALVAAVTARAGAAEELLFLIHGEYARSQGRRPRTSTEAPQPSLPQPVEVLERRALASRGDLAAARRDWAAAGLALGAAQNALLPDLDATGSVGTGGSAGRFTNAWDRVEESDEPSWSAGLVFSLPIGNRADRARKVQAEAELEQRRLALAEVENSIRLEVREARRNVELGLEKLAAAEESRRLSDRRLKAERDRLELGLGDTLRVLEAEEDAAAARSKENQARYGLAASAAALAAAVGEGEGIEETGR